MNVVIKKILKTSALFIAAVFLFQIFSVTSTYAATRTWTGTTSGSWSVGTNWSGGVAPVTGDDLVFPSGASNLSNTNDLTENTIINSISLTGSGYTLGGNPLILGAGLAGLTDSVASGGNTISLDIRLDITRDIVVTNTAETLTISGRIAGVGGINKEGTGKLVLSGANTFGGILKINVGVVNAQNSRALGTIAAGTEVVGGAALELQGTIDISYEPLTLRGYGVSNSGALRNINNNNIFRGLITLTSAGGAEIQSDSGTLTLAGGVTGAFPLVFDGAGNTTFTTTPIATAAGIVTKNGSGTLKFNFPNTYTGLTTVNAGTLLYGIDNAILSGPVTVTGGTLDIATFSDMVGIVTLGTTDLAAGTITGTTGMLSSATWTLNAGTISAIIAGDGGTVTKNTLGTVTLTRPNQYTGATSITAGILKIQDSSALGLIDGSTTITAGATLQLDGSGLSVPEYITFAGTGLLFTGAIYNTTGNNTLTGLLTMGTATGGNMIKASSSTTLTIDTKGILATANPVLFAGAGNITLTSTAPIYGAVAGSLVKNDGGILTIQSICNYTGATTINRGTLTLSGAGGLPLSAVTVNSGATFTVDNSTTTALSRLGDATALTMNGGNFNFIGSSSSIVSESTGALTLSSGHNIITVTPGAGGSTTMTFASLSRSAGATVLFRGTSFGSTPGANVSTLLFTTAPTSPALSGAGGAANSTTISVLKGAFGDNSLSGTGTDMVTYNVGNTNGLRLLNGAGFSGEYSTTLTTNTNVKLSADTVASTVSINSLILNGFNITNPGSAATITLTNAGSLSGNILINSANNIAGVNTTIGITTTSELSILATASSTISATIGAAAAGSLTLSGTGNVTLSVANPFTGLTAVNGATLTYGIADALATGALTIVGGTFNNGGFNETNIGAVTLQNGTMSGAGTVTGTSYSFREGSVSAVLAGSGAITVVATNAAADSSVTLSGNNTSTGTITVTSGILKLGATGSGANTPLGTTGGATTIANTGALDLNGFTLSTAEPITINGLGFGAANTVALGNSNSGAIMNTSGTSVSYSGPITLGAAARIAADYGTMSISSGVTGATLGLTLGGFSDMTFSGIIATTSGTLTKDGYGTVTLSGLSTFTGLTTISSGTVKLGIAGDGTNSPLGTTGAATTISSGARLDLNGIVNFTNTETLNLNGVGYGLGDFASGVLINSSATSVTFPGPTALQSASTIKADSGQITLSGANSGAFALTLGGRGTGILSGTIASSAASIVKIDTGTWTLSGASNAYTGTTSVNLGLLKIGAAGVTTSPLGTAVATTVYSGAALDLAGFALGIAEALNINGRGINDGGALMNSGGAVAFTGAIVLQNDSRIANSGSGTMTLSGGITGAFALYISGTNNFSFTTAALGMGTGTLTKQGSGTATISIASTYTGATRVDAGTLAEGVINSLSSGNLEVKGGTFDMATFTDTIGTVTLVGGSITGTTGNTLTATGYTFESGTISAILAGAVAVTKNTNNTVTLTGVNTISSTITINAGTLAISGSGSDVSVTGITINLGGTLTLDNGTTAVASRLLDTIVLTMNGGNFNFIGNSAALSTETIGQLAFASGHNVVTITPGAGGSTTLTVASNPGLSRTAGATVLFRGTSFGSTPAANVSTLMFSTAPGLTGGAGAASSTTVSVIKGAFGDSSLSGTGSDMVTYNVGNTNGLRLLNGAGFTGEYATNFATTNANVKLTANTAAATSTINSIILNGFGITDAGSAQTITLSTTGNILANSATTIAGANTTLGISTSELDVLATANATISAIIGTAVAGSLTVSGGGNITISNASNAYTSTTFINNATLTYGTSNVISSGGVTIVGGTMNLAGNSDTVGTISINAGTIATGAGTLTGNGTFSTVANNNVASIITGNLGLGANATFTINDGLMDNDALISAVISGAFTFTKQGTGVLELSGSNTYSGAGTISAGTLRLGIAGDGTNSPLGTTAGGTTVSGATAALDLNGFTLGTTEGLTLSGASLATGGLQNTSSTAATYSGLLALTTGAGTIISNYGDINISNTGTITGATFGLTIGGAGNGTLSSILGTTTGTLTKNGLGAWTLSGASTFTGATTISAGTLKLGATGDATNTPLGQSGGATTVSATGILDLNGFTLGTAEPITINGTGIAGIGAFINSSNNTISYSGAITLGTAPTIANYGSGVLTLSGNIVGSTIALTVVAVGGVTQSSASVWSGTTSSLVKQGSGTLILAGQNSITGAMTVSTGTLQLGATGGATNTPLGTIAGGVTVSAGAVLDLATFGAGGASTWEPITLNGSGLKNGGALISSSTVASTFGVLTLGSAARIINSGSGLITFAGVPAGVFNLLVGGTGPTTISGAYTAIAASITKLDSGTLTLSGANLHTGLTRVDGGTLKYGVADALGTGALTVAGGTLNLDTFNETNIGAVTLISGTITNNNGTASMTSTLVYTVESGTISAVLGSAVAAGIAKNTGGRVTLSGNNTFTSTSIAINAGYLNVQNNNALGASGTTLTTTISNGASLELQNNITLPSTKLITANGSGMEKNGAIRNVADTNTISANVTLGSTNVRINSDSGTLTIPTISGNTFNLFFGGAGTTAVTGAIGTTSGTVTKNGSGTLTLTGTNTYTGSTTILAGIISANATAAIGDGSATNTLILDGGTLQAAGTITSPSTRAVTLASTGTIDTNSFTISIAGTISGVGSLTKAGTNTLTVTGVTTLSKDLTVSGGIFAPTNVTIAGTATQSIAGFNPTGTVTMTKTAGTATFTSAMTGVGLTINGVGGTLNLGTGLTHTFTGNISLLAGTLDNGSSTLNVTSSASAAWGSNTYSTLNPGDIAAGLTLSNGNLSLAGNPPSGWANVRGTQSVSTGKWYWEVTVTSMNTNSMIGVAKATASLTTAIGTDANGYGYDGTTGNKQNNNSSVAYGSSYTTGDVIGIALDLTGGTLTFYKNGTSQGVAYSGISGTFFPAIGTSQTSTFTANFGTSAFIEPVPSGYNAGFYTTAAGATFTGSTGTIAFSGANQYVGGTATFNNLTFSGVGTKTLTSSLSVNGTFTNNGGGIPTYSTWDSANKDSTITLTNNSLTATMTATIAAVKGTIGLSSGKWYFESQIKTYIVQGIGIGNASAAVNAAFPGEDTNSYAYWDNGCLYYNNACVQAWAAPALDDVIGVAVDLDNHTLSFYKNGVLLGTQTGIASGTWYPMWGADNAGGAQTIANFGATSLAHPLAGYNSGFYSGSAGSIATTNQSITLNGDFVTTGSTPDLSSSNVTITGTKSSQAIAAFSTQGTVSMTKASGTAIIGGDLKAGSLTINGTGTLNLGTGTNPGVAGAILLTNGTLDASATTSVTAGSVSSSNTNTRVLTMGSGTWNLTGTGTVWDVSTSSNLTLTPGSSTIKITDTSTSGKTFAGGGKTYNNIWFSPSSVVTWNPSDKASGMSLTNNNLTANPTGAVDQQVRATRGVSSGKWYWELSSTNLALETNSYYGISLGSSDLNTYPGYDQYSWAFANGYGQTLHNRAALSFAGYANYTRPITDSDVLGVGLDMDNGTISFYINGVNQGIAYTGLSGTFYPSVGSYQGYTLHTTANFGATPFSYTIPAGYQAFGGSATPGSYTITGDNTFKDFKDTVNVAHSILFTSGSTQHITTWNVSGSAGNLITINSTSTGTHTLIKDVGTASMSGDYLNIQHSIVTPNGAWFAGANSVNNQNVTSAGSGWVFAVESSYRGGGGGGGGEVQNGVPYATWDPAFAAAGTALSNGNLTTTFSFYNTEIANQSLTGKKYWEVTAGANGNLLSIGIAKNTASNGGLLGADANGWAWLHGGYTYNNNVAVSFNGFTAYTTGDVVSVAFDATTGSLVFYKNGVLVGTAFTGLSGTFYPAIGGDGSGTATTNFGASSFIYTPPTGYSGVQPSATGGGSGGGASTTATGVAVVASNAVTNVNVSYGGSGYTSAPLVSICGGGGSGATATANLTGGVVTTVTVNTGGSGYTTTPAVVFGAACPAGGGGSGGGGDSG